MTLHIHDLTGCAPTPLAHYLKALGVLRLVSEQADAQARGWWEDEHFRLTTTLDEEALQQFFLEDYQPTPVVSPWNKGSGFYNPQDAAISPIARSSAARFSSFRAGIDAARQPLAAIADADRRIRELKQRTKASRTATATVRTAAAALKMDPVYRHELAVAEKAFKNAKSDLFRECFISWRGRHRDWLDAAVVVLEDGSIAWPSLFGTGGNDGRLDFTNSFMARLADLFRVESADGHPTEDARELLKQALWASPSAKLALGAKIGQYFPGAAGGPNSSNAPEGDSLINPWDFVLMIEGSLLFRSRATRRLDPAARGKTGAPFALANGNMGSGTGGIEGTRRGEQWMPLWRRPANCVELQALLGEGRLHVRTRCAQRPIDAVRAIARLGVARGIDSLVRFGYLERNGRSTIAVPLGRVDVWWRPQSHLTDDLVGWFERLERVVEGHAAGGALSHGVAQLGDAIFEAVAHDPTPDRWQAILIAAADVEAMQRRGVGFDAGPIPPLSREWLRAADDGTAEWRLARALGGAAACYDRLGRPHDPVRCHWVSLAGGGRRFLQKEKRIILDRRVVLTGRDPVSDLGALVLRRVLEGVSAGKRQLPLVAAPGCEADPTDLSALLAGEVDLARILALAPALMAVRWSDGHAAFASRPAGNAWPDERWAIVRLACLPWPLDDARTIPVDHTIVRRLLADDVAGAAAAALRRLRASGLVPPLRAASVESRVGPLLAASLAFPIGHATASKIARDFEQAKWKETR